jgi:hypothetical protein
MERRVAVNREIEELDAPWRQLRGERVLEPAVKGILDCDARGHRERAAHHGHPEGARRLREGVLTVSQAPRVRAKRLQLEVAVEIRPQLEAEPPIRRGLGVARPRQASNAVDPLGNQASSAEDVEAGGQLEQHEGPDRQHQQHGAAAQHGSGGEGHSSVAAGQSSDYKRWLTCFRRRFGRAVEPAHR